MQDDSHRLVDVVIEEPGVHLSICLTIESNADHVALRNAGRGAGLFLRHVIDRDVYTGLCEVLRRG